MGKKKDKKGKLPKTIAGLKLPKEARRQAEKAIAQLKEPIVQEMIAGAVGMAATALAKQAAEARLSRSERKPEAEPETSSEARKPAAKSGGEQFAEIATGLAVAGLGKLFEKMQGKGDADSKPAPPKA